MSRTGWSVVAIGMVLGAAILAQDRGSAQPGYPTQAHVWIENRGGDQAVPVVFAQGAGVRVVGPVTLDSSTRVNTLTARQAWEYRSVAIPAGEDAGTVLKSLGADGWEVAGVLGTAPNAVVLMKRPR